MLWFSNSTWRAHVHSLKINILHTIYSTYKCTPKHTFVHVQACAVCNQQPETVAFKLLIFSFQEKHMQQSRKPNSHPQWPGKILFCLNNSKHLKSHVLKWCLQRQVRKFILTLYSYLNEMNFNNINVTVDVAEPKTYFKYIQLKVYHHHHILWILSMTGKWL